MSKLSVVSFTFFLISVLAFSQNKKDLKNQIVQLKSETAKIQAELDKMKAEKEVDLNDELEKFSYAFGVGMGGNIKNMGFDSLSYNAFASGLEDVMLQKEKIALNEAQMLVQTAILTKQDVMAKEKSAEGEQFLAENGKREKVVTTQSGLQYEILNEGEGASPTSADKVKVHYTGKLLNGKVFDSSVERGTPITFSVTEVIKGWTEGLQLMKVGSKWKLFIPQDLAYGAQGAGGGEIPPYSALVFEIELLAIEK